MLRIRHWKLLANLQCAVAFAALAVCPGNAQVAPSGFKGPASLWVGAEYSNVNASFPYQSGSRIAGISILGEYHRDARLGVAAAARFLRFGGFESETENSYLAGPQFRFFRHAQLQLFANALVGGSTMHYPYAIGSASYFTVALAGGLNYRVRDRWAIRAEYEYQFWLNSPGYSNQPDHPLRPNGFHAGISYRIFH